ncbi:(11Z)-hexadec-11-enoyl-CoA conjugase-like [Megachile rotundata]|uniref:(11Z)-hexadec-11-enoyl-CoA conjugase-like n=1 Tax=Megachile rotundata TaxID=143995 RepID=UPI0006149EDD|nr:PREDICTED: delta(9)-fatty-acid desaturase fat-6-like [Megachile rotundata]
MEPTATKIDKRARNAGGIVSREFELSGKMESETATENQAYEVEEIVKKEKYGTDFNYKHKYLWTHILVHSVLQIGWIISIYVTIYHSKLATFIWGFTVAFIAGNVGISIGAHRYYTHRSFKQTFPFKIFVLLVQVMAGQNSMFVWVRDHRIHHRYADTDVDPHNSTRGLFFSHIGWMMAKKHPLVIKKQKEMNFDDLLEDKLLMLQYKYFLHIYFPLAMIFPMAVAMYFWNETFWCALFTTYFFPYVTNLHITWTVNSISHYWGPRPYDKRVKAVESVVSSMLTLGDSWHNFHHTFPWDYRLGEKFSIPTKMVELFEYLGLVSDLKSASPNMIHAHMKKYGDETGQEMLKKIMKSKKEEKLVNGDAHAM